MKRRKVPMDVDDDEALERRQREHWDASLTLEIMPEGWEPPKTPADHRAVRPAPVARSKPRAPPTTGRRRLAGTAPTGYSTVAGNLKREQPGPMATPIRYQQPTGVGERRCIEIASRQSGKSLEQLVPAELQALAAENEQKAPPAVAKNPLLVQLVERAALAAPSHHRLILGDCRSMAEVESETVHLALTSPPYWTLKPYPEEEGQLGLIADYEAFLDELEAVWREVHRVLVPGGRLVVVVGDVCLSRRRHGRHVVIPLHASIQERCRSIGFDNLAPIIWYKIANAKLEVENGSSFLGKPYEPNAVIKNDIEYILFQRKPGGYRQPSLAARLLSVIPEDRHRLWFQQVWTLAGASTRHHPAPFPLQLAERLVRMFSFVGDTVLDPFMGTGTTSLASLQWGRNSVGFEIEKDYFEMALQRLQQ